MTDKKDPESISPGGSPIYRHKEATPWQAPKGEECLEQISDHIDKHLGKIESVFHEIVSDTVHIDVNYVKPTSDFPFIRLITSGMSDLPMSTPEGVDAPKFAELLATLPNDWRMDEESFKNEEWFSADTFVERFGKASAQVSNLARCGAYHPQRRPAGALCR